MFQKELENLKLKNSIEFYYLFDNENFLKAFIVQIFKIAARISDETNNEFHLVFAQMNKKQTNEYLLIDYRLLFIAFLEVFENLVINEDQYTKAQTLFKSRTDSDTYDCACNLLFFLAKKEIIYFQNVKKFYTPYIYVKNKKESRLLVRIKGVAINYLTLKNLFVDDRDFLLKCEEIIDRKYTKRKRVMKSKKKTKEFNIKMSSLSKKIYFHD